MASVVGRRTPTRRSKLCCRAKEIVTSSAVDYLKGLKDGLGAKGASMIMHGDLSIRFLLQQKFCVDPRRALIAGLPAHGPREVLRIVPLGRAGGFMYFWIAVLPGVPSGLKIRSTSSDSTSLRACSNPRAPAVPLTLPKEAGALSLKTFQRHRGRHRPPNYFRPPAGNGRHHHVDQDHGRPERQTLHL